MRQWIRDAAMVMNHVVHRYQRGETRYKDLILSYAKHEQKLQVTMHIRVGTKSSKPLILLGMPSPAVLENRNSM